MAEPRWYLFHAFEKRSDARKAARQLWQSYFKVRVRSFGGKYNVYTSPPVPNDAAAWNKYKK